MEGVGGQDGLREGEQLTDDCRERGGVWGTEGLPLHRLMDGY